MEETLCLLASADNRIMTDSVNLCCLLDLFYADAFFNNNSQCIQIKRFLEEIFSPVSHRLNRFLHFPVACHNNNRYLGVELLDLLQNLNPVYVRKSQVKYDCIRNLFEGNSEAVFSA